MKGVGPLRPQRNDQNQRLCVFHGIPRASFNRQSDPPVVIGLSQPSPCSLRSARYRFSGVVLWRPCIVRDACCPGIWSRAVALPLCLKPHAHAATGHGLR